jgi:hypothetical protein
LDKNGRLLEVKKPKGSFLLSLSYALQKISRFRLV